MDLAKVVRHLRPNGMFTIIDNDYESLEWRSQDDKPTFDECAAAWPEVQRQIVNRQAENDRHQAFIAEADPLYFGWQRGENTEQAWRDKCDEIRARYPYQ